MVITSVEAFKLERSGETSCKSKRGGSTGALELQPDRSDLTAKGKGLPTLNQGGKEGIKPKALKFLTSGEGSLESTRGKFRRGQEVYFLTTDSNLYRYLFSGSKVRNHNTNQTLPRKA